jgi:hypothetical protein
MCLHRTLQMLLQILMSATLRHSFLCLRIQSYVCDFLIFLVADGVSLVAVTILSPSPLRLQLLHPERELPPADQQS